MYSNDEKIQKIDKNASVSCYVYDVINNAHYIFYGAEMFNAISENAKRVRAVAA